MTAALDTFLDGLAAECTRQREQGDLAGAFATLDTMHLALIVPALFDWLACPLVPCVPEDDGWCRVCSSLTLGLS